MKITNFINDYNGTMIITFSDKTEIIVNYNPNGLGAGIFQEIIENVWKKFEGNTTEFKASLENLLE